MRGSTTLVGAVDAALRVKKEDNGLLLQCEKQKDAEPFEDMQFDMIPIAMLGDSSLIIQRTEVERQDKRRASSQQPSRLRWIVCMMCLRKKALTDVE